VASHRAPDVQGGWLTALDSAVATKSNGEREIDQESGEVVALSSGASEEIPPQSGSLLAGVVPIDLDALERSVSRFFAQLDGQSSEAGWQRAQTLAWWLGAAATATAAFEWTRRRVFTPLGITGADAECDQAWANDPNLALWPTRDDV
jgi:hypothetical protein